MKKLLLTTMMASTLGLVACNCNQNVDSTTKGGSDEISEAVAETTTAGATGVAAATGTAALAVGSFNWDGFDKSSFNLGSFPYFNVPEGFKLTSADGENKFTKVIEDAKDGVNVFDGKIISTLKGKLGFLDIESEGETFNQAAFHDHITVKMKEIGATEITAEKHSDDVLKQLGELDGVNAQSYLDFEHDDVQLRQFALNHENGQLIYQVASDEHHGQVGVLEVDGFKAPEAVHAHDGENHEHEHDAKHDEHEHGDDEHHEHEHAHDGENHEHEHDAKHDDGVEHDEGDHKHEAELAEEPKTAEAMEKQLETSGKFTVRINFDSGKSTIRSNNMGDVETIHKLLTENADIKLSIEGHTDSSGNAASNQKLSVARANEVMSALVAKGIAADRLKATGHGDTKPVVDNDTAANRELNRRVELVQF